MSESTLKMFGVVPEKNSKNGNYVLIHEYGVLVTPKASYALPEIKKFLKETAMGFAEQNSSFWSDWKTVRDSSNFDLRMDQLLHYFTTYGLESLGIDAVKEGLVYIPNNTIKLVPSVTLRVIDAVSPDELIERCFSMFDSGMALSQDTINYLIDVLEESGYVITGDENIANREAEILFYQITGKLPNTSLKLFRYLIYHFTASSMIVNDKKTREAIKESGRRLPPLLPIQEAALAESFNRYKDLWMAIKAANLGNKRVVNRISKLSKTRHVPAPTLLMNSLTYSRYTEKQVASACEKASVIQLVRAYNAVALRRIRPESSVYRIRNSRLWTKLLSPFFLGDKEYEMYCNTILGELKKRFSNNTVYIPDNVDYAFPLSEKAFTGFIPDGTMFSFPVEADSTFLLGIHWTDVHTDLDLRADSRTESVGWNVGFRDDERTLMHSGDMTRAPQPNGASEWLNCKNGLRGTFVVKVNVFSGHCDKMKLIIGRTTNQVKKDYTIAPEEIITSLEMALEDRETILGMLFQRKNDLVFRIGGGVTGSRAVGRYSEYNQAQRDDAENKLLTELRLVDVVTLASSPEKADIDLSLEKLTKDSFVKLLK